MLVKVEGLQDDCYTEMTYENIKHYKFINHVEHINEGAEVYSGGTAPYSRLMLFYTNGETEDIFFNTKAYCMENNGSTIDILYYDVRKEGKYK